MCLRFLTASQDTTQGRQNKPAILGQDSAVIDRSLCISGLAFLEHETHGSTIKYGVTALPADVENHIMVGAWHLQLLQHMVNQRLLDVIIGELGLPPEACMILSFQIPNILSISPLPLPMFW